jgi:hypothetical protein
MGDLSEDAWNYSDPSMESLSLPTLQPAPVINDEKDTIVPKLTVCKRSQVSATSSVNGSTTSVNIKSSPAGPLTTEQNAQAPTEPATPNSNGGYLNSVLTSLSLKKEDSDSITTSPTMMSYRKTSKSKRRGTSTSSVDVTDSPLSEEPKPYASNAYDLNLYVDEKFKDTSYHYATIPRNEEFHKLFKSITADDRLLDDFSCALSRDILLQGRIYVSEHNICFNSNLLGWVTNLIIPLSDIEKFEKTTTVGLFPNGIAIHSREGRNSFVSFISRDSVFTFLEEVWKSSGGQKDESTSSHSNDSLLNMPVLSKDMDLDQDALYTAYGGALMSLDEDSPKKVPISSDESDEEFDSEESIKESKLSNQTVYKLRQGSKYKYDGPYAHGETRFPHSADNETILAKENLKCPPGVLYELLFGDHREMMIEFLKSQDSRDFSDVSYYGINDENKRERHYEYTKGLNYSVGPKQTKCVVTETIEHFDPSGYINVVNTTQTPDVPSGNSFCVKTRYLMTWGKDNTTDLTVSYWFRWTGSSWMKSIIEKSTNNGQETATTALLSMITMTLEENIQASSEEVSVDETKMAEEEVPTETLIAKPVPKPVETTSMFKDWSAFNIVVMFLLSVIVLLQLGILRGLQKIPERTFSLSSLNPLDKRTENLLYRGEEVLIWNWLDERTNSLNSSRLNELKVLQSEIDTVISKWASGHLNADESQELLKSFEARLSQYASNMIDDDEKREKVQAFKEAFGALL